jgi:hypothetical protein
MEMLAIPYTFTPVFVLSTYMTYHCLPYFVITFYQIFKTMPVIKIFFIEGYHPNLKDTEIVPVRERYLN